jgi:myosin heavy subunit
MQAPGERNFHIFYQLLSSGDQSLLNKLDLATGTYYHYLNSSIVNRNLIEKANAIVIIVDCALIGLNEG